MCDGAESAVSYILLMWGIRAAVVGWIGGSRMMDWTDLG